MDVLQDKMDVALQDLNGYLKLMEEKFVQDRPFIAGDHISLVDLVAIVEVMQVSIENAPSLEDQNNNFSITYVGKYKHVYSKKNIFFI